MTLDESVREVVQVVKQSLPWYRFWERRKLVKRVKTIVDSFPGKSKVVAEGITSARDRKVDVGRLMDLLEGSRESFAIEISETMSSYLNLRKGSEYLYLKVMERYQEHPQHAAIISKGAKELSFLTTLNSSLISPLNLHRFMEIWDYLQAERWQPYVVDEFTGYFINEVSSEGLFLRAITQADFLNQQSSETVFPLAVIMEGLGEKYLDSIKSLDGGTRQYLALAYCIARDNIDEDTGENCLEQFYVGVKGMLEERPDDLEKWAASICSDFRKQGEAGLLRGVVG